MVHSTMFSNNGHNSTPTPCALLHLALTFLPSKGRKAVCASSLESGKLETCLITKGIPWKSRHVTLKARPEKAMKLDAHPWSPEPPGKKCDYDEATML